MDRTIVYKASKELIAINPSKEQLAKHEKKLETIVLFFIDKTKRTREDYNVLDRCLEDEYHENLGFIKLIYRSCINEYVLWGNKIKTQKNEIPSSEGHIDFYSKFGAVTGGFGGAELSLFISMLNPNLLPGLIIYLIPMGLLFGLCLGHDYGKKLENEIATSNVKLRKDLDKLIQWYPKEINSKYAKLLCAFTESNNLLK